MSHSFRSLTAVTALYVFDSIKKKNNHKSHLFVNPTTVVVQYVFDSLQITDSYESLFGRLTVLMVLY